MPRAPVILLMHILPMVIIHQPHSRLLKYQLYACYQCGAPCAPYPHAIAPGFLQSPAPTPCSSTAAKEGTRRFIISLID